MVVTQPSPLLEGGPSEGDVRAWIGSALDAGLEGSGILGALHAKSPSLEMPAMQRALRLEAEAVNGSMLELMSSTYGKFYDVAQSVSADCDCRESREALLRLHEELGRSVREAARGAVEAEAELEKRRLARKQRREADAIERFELLLVELEQAIGSADPDVERAAHASLSLRAQLSSAVDLLSEGAKVTRLHELASRVDDAERGAAMLVEAAFDRLCCRRAEPGKRGAVEVCLRAAAALGLGKRLEERFAEKTLRAFLDATYTRSRLDGADKGSCSGLPSIYAATLDYVQERCQTALQACEAANTAVDRPSLLAVDLVCNGVWRPVATAVVEKLSPVFDLGIAGVAHRSYQATFRFIQDLARLAAVDDLTASYVSKRLRAHPATGDLERRWDLRVYFELVKVEVVAGLDALLFPEPDFVVVEDAKPAKPSPFVDLLVKSARRVWEPEPTRHGFFLKPLAPDCARLTFDLVAKALRVCSERLDNEADQSPEALAQVALDVHLAAATISSQVPAKVADALRGLDHALPEDAPLDLFVRALDQSVLRDASPLVRRALDKLLAALVDKTAQGLRAVKGVPARYHLTNQPTPTAPSPYLEDDALAWLCDKFDARWRDALPANDAFFPTLASRVMEAFAPRVTDVLTQAKLFHQSLKKRHKNPTLRDYHNVATQLLLDVDHLHQRLANLARHDPNLDSSSLDKCRVALQDAIHATDL